MVNQQIQGVILQASSRSTGHTTTIVRHLNQYLGFDIIDLKSLRIGYFDYAHQNATDDFIPLMKKVVRDYDTLLFASPVYWYSMSAEMKTFFDRLSDLLKTEKDVGRQLRGKRMAVLSCSESDDAPTSFYTPFILSADYLGMEFLGHGHAYVVQEVVPHLIKNRLLNFAQLIHDSII